MRSEQPGLLTEFQSSRESSPLAGVKRMMTLPVRGPLLSRPATLPQRPRTASLFPGYPPTAQNGKQHQDRLQQCRRRNDRTSV